MDCILQSWNARRAVNYGGKLTAVDQIILIKSDPMTHSEFEFSSRNDGISFSATMRDNQDCCRFMDISYSHPNRWTSLVLPMTDEQEDRAYARAAKLNGMGYDLIGLGSFGTKWDIIKPHPDKLWCSEACAELIKAAYGYGDDFVPHFYSPTSLYFEMVHRLAKK